MAFTSVNLVCSVDKPDGTNASGTITFELTHAIADTDGNVIAARTPITTTLVSGSSTVSLYATNDTNTIPSGVTYKVTETITSSPTRVYEITLTSSPTTQYLADLVPATTTPAWSYLLEPGSRTDNLVLTADSSSALGYKWAVVTGSSGSGVTDHGALTGLIDNDHPQYALRSNDLSDLVSSGNARVNLGLGSLATASSITAASVSDFTEAAQDAVGTALTSTSTVSFYYNDSANTITAAVPQWNAMGEPSGFANRTDSTLGWSNGSRTITLTGTYDIWVNGAKQTKTGDSATITDTEGLWYFFYDTAGTFTSSQTAWTLADGKVPVAVVNWDADNDKGVLQEERHGLTMDGATHLYLHTTRGAQVSGGTISGYTTNSNADSAITFAIASATLYDEDIQLTLGALADGGPYTMYWRSGATGVWRWDETPTVPVLQSGAFAKYNLLSGSTWILQATTTNRFFNSYLVATNAITPTSTHRYVIIPGQADYASQAAAEAETFASLALGTLPGNEWAVLYRLTWSALTANTTTGKVRLASVARQIGTNITVNGITPGNHSALSNRSDVGSHPATAVATDTTNFAGVLSAADTDVQAALDTIDNLSVTSSMIADGTIVNVDVSSSAAVATTKLANPANAEILVGAWRHFR